MEVRGHIIEYYGLKASQKGCFDEWRALSASIQEAKNLPGYEAAELAYKQLKLQGSE